MINGMRAALIVQGDINEKIIKPAWVAKTLPLTAREKRAKKGTRGGAKNQGGEDESEYFTRIDEPTSIRVDGQARIRVDGQARIRVDGNARIRVDIRKAAACRSCSHRPVATTQFRKKSPAARLSKELALVLQIELAAAIRVRRFGDEQVWA
eukprot:6207761-Pleurochrysis_carterae.AAC.1